MNFLEHFQNILQNAKPSHHYPNKEITDKGTCHDYINGYYNNKFTSIKDEKITLLEIGVHYGFSMDLWMSWFTNANFIGIEPIVLDGLNRHKENPKFKGMNLDAFCKETLDLIPDESIDIIIEDGPHTLPTQIFAADNWSKKLKSGGVLIIEDIQSPDSSVEEIIKNIKNDKNFEINLFDLRSNLGRWDDYIIEIKKLCPLIQEDY